MRSILSVIAVALLLLLMGCAEEPVTATSTTDYASAVEAAKTAKAQSQAQSARATAATADAGAILEEGQSNLEDGFGVVDDRYAYAGTDLRDPFRSFQYLTDEETPGGYGPLGDYELQQLSVVAVVWDTGKPRALVADPGGRSFIVHEGSLVGKHNGRVIHIGDNLVLVKETYVNFAGEQTTRDVEMRIRRSQGG